MLYTVQSGYHVHVYDNYQDAYKAFKKYSEEYINTYVVKLLAHLPNEEVHFVLEEIGEDFDDSIPEEFFEYEDYSYDEQQQLPLENYSKSYKEWFKCAYDDDLYSNIEEGWIIDDEYELYLHTILDSWAKEVVNNITTKNPYFDIKVYDRKFAEAGYIKAWEAYKEQCPVIADYMEKEFTRGLLILNNYLDNLLHY